MSRIRPACSVFLLLTLSCVLAGGCQNQLERKPEPQTPEHARLRQEKKGE